MFSCLLNNCRKCKISPLHTRCFSSNYDDTRRRKFALPRKQFTHPKSLNNRNAPTAEPSSVHPFYDQISNIGSNFSNDVELQHQQHFENARNEQKMQAMRDVLPSNFYKMSEKKKDVYWKKYKRKLFSDKKRQKMMMDSKENAGKNEQIRKAGISKKFKQKAHPSRAETIALNDKKANVNELHGILQMFDGQSEYQTIDNSHEQNENEIWFNNPQHIKEVENFLKQEYWPWTWNENNIIAEHLTTDKNITSEKALKQTSNIVKENEFLPANLSNDETEDVSLHIWDDLQQKFVHPRMKTKKEIGDANEYVYKRVQKGNKTYVRRRKRKPDAVHRTAIIGSKAHWLQLANDEKDIRILRKMNDRLPFAYRYFSQTPNGNYKMSKGMTDHLQKLLVKEYWPSGWNEKKSNMRFGQRLFNALPVKYDRRKVLRYIANEFPLSLSVNYRILRELQHRMPDFQPSGMLDFGMGVGCASIAALDVYGSRPAMKDMEDSYFGKTFKHKTHALKYKHLLENIHRNKEHSMDSGPLRSVFGIEPSNVMKEYSDVIMEDYKKTHNIRMIPDMKHPLAKQPLVMCSFVLSEIAGNEQQLCEYLDQMWHSSKKVIVLIEAGNVDGYNLINFARSYLLSKFPPSDDIQRPGTFTIAPVS